MTSLLALFFALAIAALALHSGGRWRERARQAERQTLTDRKAHDIQNKVALDSAYRERVRRDFDGA